MKLDIKKIKKLFFTLLLFMPMVVFAESSEKIVFGDVFMGHVFLTIFSYLTLISPLSIILKSDKESQKEMEHTLFWGRIILIIAIGMFAPGLGFALDFISVFVGAFLIIPKSEKVNSARQNEVSVSVSNLVIPLKKVCPKCNELVKDTDLFCIKCGEKFETVQNATTVTYTCPKCKRKLPPGNNFCINCGQSVEISQAEVTNTPLKCSNCSTELLATDLFCTKCGHPTNFISSPLSKGVFTEQNGSTIPSASSGTALNTANFAYYSMNEDQMLATIIEEEIKKCGEGKFVSVADLEKKKTVLSFIYALILFIFISLMFFHTKTFGLIVIMLIISFLYFGKVRKYNIIQYLKKEIKSRPDEKINYIVSSILAGKTTKGSYVLFRLLVIVIAVLVPLCVFREPHMIFERQDEGYVVRFYTIGLLENDRVLEIPEEYKGKPVIGIRGDVFANVYTLEEVILPDTIQEIRGGAFKNAIFLRKINLPDGIEEIKGNTFENCYNLEKIEIPDSVIRIGGHAFRNDSNLEEVIISKNSKLEEIGSSAFRNCTSLESIRIPRGVSINERAFKESPTVVREYTVGELNNYGSDVSQNFEYTSSYFIKIGETTDVNPYRSQAKLQNATITLVSVNKVRDAYQFELRYRDSYETKTFVLTESKPYFNINNKVIFEITSDYVFEGYSDRISFYSYYN